MSNYARQKAYEDGYEAGKNEWRYSPPDFRTDAVAHENYNKGWKAGIEAKKRHEKEIGL